MSTDRIVLGVAVRLKKPMSNVENEDFNELWCNYGGAVNYEGDFVYYKFIHDELYKFNGFAVLDHIWEIGHQRLDEIIEKSGLDVFDDRRTFIDIWYDGSDAPIDTKTWKDIE